MALTKQSDGAAKAKMAFGEHREMDKALVSPKKEKRMQVVFDEEFHTRFKMACLKNSTTISAVIKEQAEKWLKENE